MSKRMDNIVNELTNHIEKQMQTEVEIALGVKHRKEVGDYWFMGKRQIERVPKEH